MKSNNFIQRGFNEILYKNDSLNMVILYKE